MRKLRTVVVVVLVLVAMSVVVTSCAQSSNGVTTPLDITFVPLDYAGSHDMADAAVSDDASMRDASIPDLARPDEAKPMMCDLGGDGGSVEKLFVALTTTSGAPFAAERSTDEWTSLPVGTANVTSQSAVSYAGVPMIVMRLSDDTLSATIEDPCAGSFAAPATLFANALTGSRPAAVGGTQVDVIFRGSINGDQRLFATTYTGVWSAALTLGNFLTNQAATALRMGSDVHVLFTGTDTNIYDGVVDKNGGAATQITGAMSGDGPVGVISSGGTAYMIFRGTDTNFYGSQRASGGSWSAPLSLCTGQANTCVINSDLPPVVALDHSDSPNVAWHGTDGITYVTRLVAGQWSTPVAATTEVSTLSPAIATGLSGNDIEIVYVRSSDSHARHVSKTGGTFTAADDVSTTAMGGAPVLTLVP
jgi:hypothetical protein